MEPNMWEMSDDRLMDELKAALVPRDPIPEPIIDAAKASFAWRGIDGELELLSLSFDSSLTDAAVVRGLVATSERSLVFESEDMTMTLEVGPQVLMGQIVPARPDRVILEDAQGQVDETEADGSGFFLLRRPGAGPLRLKWHGPDTTVVTEWVSI